jgi:hypothetical protein
MENRSAAWQHGCHAEFDEATLIQNSLMEVIHVGMTGLQAMLNLYVRLHHCLKFKYLF